MEYITPEFLNDAIQGLVAIDIEVLKALATKINAEVDRVLTPPAA
jgi:hypothetical protein